jgi:hypothetical protein
MIDPLCGELLSMNEAVDVFPSRRGGSKVSRVTLHRWITRGAKGVRLETVKVGGMIYTTKDAIREFIRACSNAEEPQA